MENQHKRVQQETAYKVYLSSQNFVACAHQPRPQSPTGDLGDIAGVKRRNGKGLCQGGSY